MKKGKIILSKKNFPADARIDESKPGYKAGNELLDDLVNLIRNFQDKAKSVFPYIEREVNEIIISKSKDTFRIERTLDYLLDSYYLGLGYEEFKKLNTYYESVHKRNSKQY